MADKRMFSKKITSSARFLRMPISSQALYFHLGMYADDEGVVEAFSITRMVGCSEDDLKVLEAKGFIQILNEDLVSFIVDWDVNNSIRADRRVESIYKNLLTVKCQTDDGQMSGRCQTSDGQVTDACPTNDRIDKYSIDKSSIDKSSIESESMYKDSHARAREDTPTMSVTPDRVQPPSAEVKQYNRYGLFNNVLLTDREFTQLRLTYKDYQDKIENLSSYMQQNGKMYADHYATICKWAREDAQKARSGTTKTADMLEEFYDMTDNWAQS